MSHNNPEPKMLSEIKSRTRIYPSAARQAFIAKRLKGILVPAEGENYTDLAARIGISLQLLRELRAGNTPSLGVLLLICDAFLVTPDWILGFKEEKDV